MNNLDGVAVEVVDLLPPKEGLFRPHSSRRPHNTANVPPRFASVGVLDVFGGEAGGLAAALAVGYNVAGYQYIDTDDKARAAASHHLRLLREEYQERLPASALVGWDAAPQSVPLARYTQSSSPRLASRLTDTNGWRLAKQLDRNLLLQPELPIFAGWPCQPRSPAGLGGGINDDRAGVVDVLSDLLDSIQLLRNAAGLQPAVYWLENVPVGPNACVAVRADQERVVALFGQPVVVDAARFGARAHRRRSFWTNSVSTNVLSAVVPTWGRANGLTVQQVLSPGLFARPSPRNDTFRSNSYACNVKDQPLAALPTPMATAESWAFDVEHDPLSAGLIYEASSDSTVSPPPDCMERAMGYATGATGAPRLSGAARRAVIGNAFDISTLTALLSLTIALAERDARLTAEICLADAAATETTEAENKGADVSDAVSSLLSQLATLCAEPSTAALTKFSAQPASALSAAADAGQTPFPPRKRRPEEDVPPRRGRAARPAEGADQAAQLVRRCVWLETGTCGPVHQRRVSRERGQGCCTFGLDKPA